MADLADRVETVYRDVSYTYLLFPAWIGSYRLGEKRWQLIVNGATGTVDGDRPYSVVKIASTVVAILAALVALAALIVLLNRG